MPVASSDLPESNFQTPGTPSDVARASARVTGPASRYMKRTLWSGLLAGFGVAAFLDETIFHQILHWHHFYDKSTIAVGLLSDGLFHAFGFTSLVVGLFLMADSLRRGASSPSAGGAHCCWERGAFSFMTAPSSTSS